MAKALPIGIDSFRKIRENGYYYVDKSLMIKDFLDFKIGVSLITRPRRFGKTLNMTMLREFFDICQDSASIFEGLNIMETEYASQINSRPVIYLTLKNCSGKTVEMMKNDLVHTLKSEYFRCEEILREQVDFETSDYHEFYSIFRVLTKITEGTENKGSILKISQMPDEMLKRSLVVLTQALAKFYDKKVLLLIDEYDQLLIKNYETESCETFSKEIYGPFLGHALKGNDYLKQALLTGIQQVVFPEVNNLMDYTVLSKKYSSYFGLTTKETKELLEYYDLELDENIASYYGGYSFSGIDIYNPWSILSYANEKELKSYWINTSTNDLIRTIFQADAYFHKNFNKLIANGHLAIRLNMVSFIGLAKTETLWGLLVNAGYLTVTHVDYHIMRFTVRIPNNEIKREFESIVSHHTKSSSDEMIEY